jgi:hypothetical protein
MSEILRKPGNYIRAALVAGVLSPLALGACSTNETVETAIFEVGVECPPETNLKVNSVSDVYNGGSYYVSAADIEVSCKDEQGESSRPVSMELLSGIGTVVEDGSQDTLTPLTIEIKHQQGGGFDGNGDQDPEIELSGGSIDLSELRSIERVVVG